MVVALVVTETHTEKELCAEPEEGFRQHIPGKPSALALMVSIRNLLGEYSATNWYEVVNVAE